MRSPSIQIQVVHDIGCTSPTDDDVSQISSSSLDDGTARDIYGNLGDCPNDVSATTTPNRATENSSELKDLPDLLDRHPALLQPPQ